MMLAYRRRLGSVSIQALRVEFCTVQDESLHVIPHTHSDYDPWFESWTEDTAILKRVSWMVNRKRSPESRVYTRYIYH